MPVREWHRSELQKAKDCTKEGLGVYTTGESGNCEKYMKDHTYCIIFIHPRNHLIDDNKNQIDFRLVENKLLYKYSQMIFDIWEVIVKDSVCRWIHCQEPSASYTNTCWNMDDRFAHNDKSLYVWPHKLNKIRLVAQTQFYWDNRAHIKVLENINY